jgi:outer membrane immunogenic protein
MKKFLLGSVALAAMIAGPAMAADMPLKAPPPVVYYSWTGCYGGGQVGYKGGRSQHIYGGLSGGQVNAVLQGRGFVAGSELTDPFNVNGAIGGFEAGCQYQWSNWLVGVEVDGSWSTADGQGTSGAAAIAAGVSAFQIYRTSQRWLATARGRLGYAQDKWLFYVTGGAAYAGFDLTNSLPTNLNPFAQQNPTQVSKGGWVVGFGGEYALGYGWSIKSEVLYAGFNNLHYGDYPAPCAPPALVAQIGGGCPNADVKMQEWIWRFGMNYKFDWGGPIVAKY